MKFYINKVHFLKIPCFDSEIEKEYRKKRDQNIVYIFKNLKYYLYKPQLFSKYTNDGFLFFIFYFLIFFLADMFYVYIWKGQYDCGKFSTLWLLASQVECCVCVMDN